MIRRSPALAGPMALLAGLLLAQPGLANDTSVTFIGGVPSLVKETHISMQAEKLSFSYVQPKLIPKRGLCPTGSWQAEETCHFAAYWQADLSYTFVNRGPAKTLTIGLPFDMPDCEFESDVHGPRLCDPEGVRDLTTTLDGKPLQVSRKDVKVTGPVAFNRLYLVTVPFAKGQPRTLRHRYQSHVISSIGGMRFRYLLRTGSNWAGPIGQVEISFELPPANGPCATANLPHVYDGRWLKIKLSDWKPDRDLDIVFAEPARTLIGSEINGWGNSLEEVCGSALKFDASERRSLAARVELLYGAPGIGREAVFAEGPLPLCRNVDYFSLIANQDQEFMPHVGLAGLRFIPQPNFVAQLPPLLKACIEALKTPDQSPSVL